MPTKRAEAIGARIRRLREERGLSQRELAEPGLSYGYLSRIEAGQRVPSEKALRKLAAKLGVTPRYIEGGSDNATCPHCGRAPTSTGPGGRAPHPAQVHWGTEIGAMEPLRSP